MNKRMFPMVAMVTLLFGALYVFPRLQTPTIDSSWWIVANIGDQYDGISAQWAHEAFGAKMVDIIKVEEYDVWGQNLLIIGGSFIEGGLYEKAPWLRPLSIARPNDFPKVYFSPGKKLNTPTTVYSCNPDDADYGFIAKGYDYALRRYVVTVIGWSAQCTGTGTVLLIEQTDAVLSYSYIVYRRTAHSLGDASEWKQDEFGYEIVEMG